MCISANGLQASHCDAPPPPPISRHFRSILNFFFHKMTAVGHFGWLKITFDRISRHCRSIRNFDFVHKMDDRKSLSNAFLAISDQYICSKWPKTIGFFHYVLSMAMPNMNLIGEFMTQLETPQAFEHFYTKWSPETILFFRLMPKIIRFL